MKLLEKEILDLVFEYGVNLYDQGYCDAEGDFRDQYEEALNNLSDQICEKIHDLILQVDHSNLVVESVREHIEKLTKAEVQAEPVAGDYPHEQMDALALARYKVVPSDQSMYWRHAVVAGDGQQHLYNGSEVDCQNMARKFAGAFFDGAFAFHERYSAPQAQPADALDAERWRMLPAFYEEYQINGLKLMRDIDAAMAAAQETKP